MVGPLRRLYDTGTTPRNGGNRMNKTELKLLDDGPILVTGEWNLVDSGGKLVASNETKPVALCRCGTSGKKPFCDGSHKASGFRSGLPAR